MPSACMQLSDPATGGVATSYSFIGKLEHNLAMPTLCLLKVRKSLVEMGVGVISVT